MGGRFWRIVTIITVWHVAASVCYYVVHAGTPLFRDAFELSALEIGLVITALTLGYAISLLPFGVATDRLGERLTLTGGLLGLSLGTLAVAIAPTYWLLLAAVFLLGSMYGSATPGTNKAIFDRIEPGRQHRAIGIKQIGPTVGSAVSAVLVTGFAGLLFWQFGFLVAAGFGLTVAATFFLSYRVSDRADPNVPDFRALGTNRTFVLVLSAGVCIGAAFYTTAGYTVLFVDESIGATIATGGLVLAILQIASSVGRIVAGTVADVLPGPPTVRTAAIFVFQTACGGALFVLLALTETVLTAGVVFAGLGVFVLGSAGIYYSCISTIVADDELGAASAAGQLAMVVGGLFAPPTFGYLVDASGYWAAWGFLASLSFAAAGIVSVVIIETGRL